MAKKRLFTVTDLGGGDGGKGGVVHKICCETNAHTVLKVGGAQGSHGVSNSNGQSFNFSQFGCGTLEGTKSHITDLMVVEPYGLVYEGRQLQYKFGIKEAFDLLTVDEEALCITPFHTFESRLQELARKGNPKGTIGIGAGVAMLDSERYPDLAIYAKDLDDSNLLAKIRMIQDQKIANLETYLDVPTLFKEDQKTAKELIETLTDRTLPERIVNQFNGMAKLTKVVDKSHLKKILSMDGTVVVESSHGVLTDRYYGFHPNVSRLRTMPNFTWDMIEELGYGGQMFKLGVSRAYTIRHGAGPMVTESKSFTSKLFEGSHKDNNRWQGDVRAGPLDFVALRYAIECCGGKNAFDGIAITWLDQILDSGKWEVCNQYENTSDSELFTEDGEIKVGHEVNAQKISHQQKLNMALNNCSPVIESYDSCGNAENAVELCRGKVLENLGLPVRMVSVGPTEKQKLLF